MNIPSLSPEPISHTKQKKLFKNKKIVYGLMIFSVVFSLGWLITKRFSGDPLDKIDNYLIAKKLDKAAKLNYELLQKSPEHRLALLMNGSIINFGIREMNITDTHLPFYEYDDFLEKEDKTGVFIRQSFLKKFSIFPDSVYFLDDFCHFKQTWPESLRNPETGIIINRSLHSKTIWNKVSNKCLNDIFHDTDNLKGMFAKVVGDNLSVREKPEKKSKTLTKLKRNETVLIKLQGGEETIGNKKGNWYFVLSEDQIYGWVFGGYLEKQP
jgi:hypothetical protein